MVVVVKAVVAHAIVAVVVVVQVFWAVIKMIAAAEMSSADVYRPPVNERDSKSPGNRGYK
jgi:hypothetical protein